MSLTQRAPAELHAKHRNARFTNIPLALVFTLSALTACTGTAAELTDISSALPEVSIQEFSEEHAVLDFELGTVTTPISDYLLTSDFNTEVLFAQAHHTLVADCMTSAGYRYGELAAVNWGALQPRENWSFGRWVVASAAAFGSTMDETRGIPKTTTVDQGPAFNTALNTCNTESYSDTAFSAVSQSLQIPSIADRISGNAYSLARRSAQGKAAATRYTACMENKSIVLDPESEAATAEYSELGKEAEIAAEVAEAECNLETGRIQELFDISAQYEAAYMKKYEAQLPEALKQKQDIHAQLQNIIERSA